MSLNAVLHLTRKRLHAASISALRVRLTVVTIHLISMS
jgi:hypothetical protein